MKETLKPWRQVAVPHRDVSGGRYQKAEFAADLAQVLQGKAEPEYQDPVEFFARTHLTSGMKSLLTVALKRTGGEGGEPVVQLKTSFGGGKTHSMLALLHLFQEPNPSRLQGIPAILEEAGVAKVPSCRVSVLVGTALDPTKPHRHPNLKRASVRTLWGEMAAQLGGKDRGDEIYELVRTADEKGVAPGADTLVEMFGSLGPSLILIDELVAYARNIYHVHDLAGGSFDSNMTFVQNLTEAVRRSPETIIIASIPESEIEIGGEGGQAALERIGSTFGRLEAVWQPVGHLESFEVVRRRLFNAVTEEDQPAKDAACSAFYRLYREHDTEFPPGCKEGEYLARLKAAYPIHPEFFDRLYEDWATLEKFQRTRGVLRLMAAVVHELWRKEDASALIMPGSLPLYAADVRNELTRYLGDQWNNLIDKDVDGTESEPVRIDLDSPRFGGVSAARRVARTIFLGSAPSVKQQTVRGLDDARLRLGVVQPGENIATFTDALSRLVDRLTYLYHDGNRYWFDLRPNLRRTMEERAAQLDPISVENELIERIGEMGRGERGVFAAVHPTSDFREVRDDPEARLVVFRSDVTHRKNGKGNDSPAVARAQEILASKSSGPRDYPNMLIFLAPDFYAIQGCLQETRKFLAWSSINDEADQLGLDGPQKRQSKEEQNRARQTVDAKIGEAYSWLLVPHQDLSEDGKAGELQWEITRLTGAEDGPIARASKRALRDGALVTQWSPQLLRMALDRVLWKGLNDVSLSSLWGCLTKYLYLTRLRDEKVFVDCVRDGLRSRDFFAYASGRLADGRYAGLSWGEGSPRVLMDSESLLVRPEIAVKQGSTTPSDTAEQGHLGSWTGQTHLDTTSRLRTGGIGATEQAGLPTRFHGSVSVDPQRAGRDAGKITEEILVHLLNIASAEVTVTVEIHATIPKGVPESVVRTVTENARTLKFRDSGFERE